MFVVAHPGACVRLHPCQWAAFNQKVKNGPDFSDLVGVELYDMTDMGTWPDTNVAHHEKYAQIAKRLSDLLHAGPTTGGGWGPYHHQ